MLRHFDVCSGIGGFSLGFRWAALSEPVAFCEIDPYCQKVLAKNFPNIPIFNDVKELVNDRPESTRTIPDHDILTSGYPCQPFSVAGQRRGEEDERNIWRFVFEIVKRKHPTWCVFENVYGHIAMGLDQVLHDMESEGYSTQTFVVPACSLNAPHKRDRLWLVCNLADTKSEGLQGLDKRSATISTERDEITDIGTKGSGDKDVANSKCMGRESRTSVREELAREESHGKFNNRSTDGSAQERARSWWDVEPNVGRVAYGIPSRVDRLRGLGNAIVPQIAMQIGLSIKEAMNDDYTKKD
jgi:DNA (cytosine-5)-methyltransferase 1